MIVYLSLDRILAIHRIMIERYGGSDHILDMGKIESAVAQPQMAFGGEDLYPTLEEKASALGFSLTNNHGFGDGNKRVGFGAMDAFLRANGHKIVAPVDEMHAVFLSISDHKMNRNEFTEWIRQHLVAIS